MPSIVPAVIGAAGVLGGTALSNNQQQSATNEQLQMQELGLQTEQDMFTQERDDLAPYRMAGAGALSSLQALLGIKNGPAGSNVKFPKMPSIPASKSMFQTMADPANLFGGNTSQAMDPIGWAIGGNADLVSHGLRAIGQPVHRAGGGGVGPGTFVVGERGPEILHMAPGAHGFVEPNSPTANMLAYGGSGGIHRAGGGAVFNPLTGNNVKLSSGQTVNSVLQQAPQYQFTLQQGIQGLDHSAAASGNLLSGQHMADILNYSQGLASNTFQGIVNNLSNVASLGASASSMGAQNGMYTGMSMANLFGQMGSSMYNGSVAQGNNMSQGLGQMATLFGNMYGGG